MAEVSDFVATGKKAWWLVTRQAVIDAGVTDPLPNAFAKRQRCSANGLGVLTTVQSVLRNGLLAPWQSYDGSHSRKPTIDGNFGPESMAALYAYAKQQGLPDYILNTIKQDGQAKRISNTSMAAAILLTYYKPRQVRVPQGAGSVDRTDTPILGVLTSTDVLTVPENAVLWKFKERPEISVDLVGLGIEYPECQQEGEGWTLDTLAIPANLNVQQSIPSAEQGASSGGGGGGLLVVALVALTAYALSD
jgi:hypothetical protein